MRAFLILSGSLLFSSCTMFPLFGPTVHDAVLEPLFRADSSWFGSTRWASNGDIYYMVTTPDSATSGLFVVDTVTGESRRLGYISGGLMAVASDGRVAVAARQTLSVYDSDGVELFVRNVVYEPRTLQFAADGNALYYTATGEQGRGLFRVELMQGSAIEAVLLDVGFGLVAPDGSFFVYKDPTSGVQWGVRNRFYRYTFATQKTEFLYETGNTYGFSINPVSPDIIAVGEAGDGRSRYWGRRVRVFDARTGKSTLYHATPFDSSEVGVCDWSPDGQHVVLRLQLYIMGDPCRRIGSEIWLARELHD